MSKILYYLDKNVGDKAIDIIDKNGNFEIIVDNGIHIKWFFWYLPHVLDFSGKSKSPMLKTIIGFIILRKFHAIIGTASLKGGYDIGHDFLNDQLYIYFKNISC